MSDGAAGPILLTEMALADQRVRDRIEQDLETTLIIEAAAGTGKTTALVSRIIAVLARGLTTLERIVAVTFTEKAAGELKLRLRGEIEKARRDEARFDAAARARLTASLEKLEEAHIGTIHSFCADLLRERPIAAGVDPAFEIAPEEQARELAARAFDRWFEEALAAPGPGLRRILRRRQLAEREGPRPLLMAAADTLREWRDFDTPWRGEAFDRDAMIDQLVETILSAGKDACSADPEDWLRRSFERIAQPVREALRLETVRERDYDELEDILLRLLIVDQRHWNWRGKGERFGRLLRAEALARRASLRTALMDFRERAGANLAPQLRAELAPVLAYYAKLKQSRGLLDFRDLLLLARDLVTRDRLVRRELQERFTHIFVDEFQDTEPLQAELLLLLATTDEDATDWREAASASGKLFIVGDPKQSIYRFRRADVALYQDIKLRLCARGAALEHLTVSFRAVSPIQEAVNAAFAPLMAEETSSQPRYAALQPFRRAIETQPAVIALPVPAPYGDYGRVTKWAIERSLPDAIAAFVAWLLEESGWTVTEREGGETRAPIRARHICLLFRRLNQWRGGQARDVTREYVRALESRRIEHVLVRGGSFHQREEIEALRNALAAIERPDDELSVYATLRGPLFGLTDGALLEYRETRGSLHPFRPKLESSPETLREVQEALEILRGLHRGRNRRPIAATVAQLLGATRAHAGIAIWPTGEQALANVTRLMDLARRYEAGSGATSLRGFVSMLEARAEREEAGDTPVVEEGAEGVRLMSVHSAKGLEFPIVVLADPTCNETSAAPARFVEPAQRLCAQMLAGCAPRELLEHGAEEHRRDQEEAVRVLYVAATRARDLLVAPVVGDERVEGWLSKFDPALYPHAETALSAARPAGCPEFKAGPAGYRPPNAQPKSRGVAAGAHRPECGAHQVVWWDPAALRLDARESMGLRQTRLLEADESGERSGRGQRDYEAWRVARGERLAAGARPSLSVMAATERAAVQKIDAEGAGIAIVELARATVRPHGVRFGTLTHNVLARVALDASDAQTRELATFFGRELGASADEIEAAAAAVSAAIQAPLLRRAAQAGELRREAPLALMLDDGTLIEGIADMVFRETAPDGSSKWTVVDFKTDADFHGRLDEYRAQLALYLDGVRRATGEAAAGILLVL